MQRLVVAALTWCTGCLFVDVHPEGNEDLSDGVPVADAGPPEPEPDAFVPIDPGDCASVGPCPAPSAGKAQLCGRIVDTGTSAPVDEQRPPVRAIAVDALAFANNPQAPEAFLAELVVDPCGRFHAGAGVTPPATQFVGVAVDDPLGGADHWINTGVALAVFPNLVVDDVLAFATPRATAATWDAASGLASSFEQLGAVLQIFVDPALPLPPLPGTPVAGVSSLVSGAPTAAEDTFYFADGEPLARLELAPAASATGASGSALLVGTALSNHGGSGGEPPGQTWPSRLAASIPGVIFVQLVVAE